MKKLSVLIILLITMIEVAVMGCAAAGVVVSELTCEYLRDPLGLDVQHPRLSWVLQSDKRGEAQTAYQVLVATSKEKLDSGVGDLWDSGKVQSDQSVHVAYAGKVLASNDKCFWKVRVWSRDGSPSGWSEIALWTMGLLRSDDWKGKWIALDTELTHTEGLNGAQWIWFSEGGSTSEFPAATRYFRKSFTVSPSGDVRSAKLWVTADDSCTVYLNGSKIGETANWKTAFDFNIKDMLKDGQNVLAVSASNETPGPAGLMVKAVIGFTDGRTLIFSTDGAWKTSDSGPAGWMAADFNDSGWQNAVVIGAVGIDPWKTPSPRLTHTVPSPLFRKGFNLVKPVKSAYVYVCGLGYYELYLNGKKAGDQVLAPGFTKYDKKALYVTHDVTRILKKGENAVGVMLGNGWYNMHARDAWDFDRSPWRNTPRFILQLHVRYKDGTGEVITSDGSWKAARGPVVFDCIRNGETYDARQEKPGWNTAGYADAGWESVKVVDGPAGKLTAQKTLPIKVIRTIKPVKVTQPKPGVYVFDVGQNISGWTRLRVSGPAGTAVTLKYDERISKDGFVDQQNASLVYSGKFQTDTYILKGEGNEVWEPRFVYHGFQYVQVEGYPGEPTLDSLQACVVHTDFESTGSIKCSNDLLNRIQQNTLWSYVSNFVGYPTDCPHREKNGWTGDAHIAAETGLMNFNPASSYTKWMGDFKDEQKENGEYAAIIPTSGWGYGIGPAWDSAYPLITQALHTYCGDRRILEEHYDKLKLYLEYLGSRAEEYIVTYGLGDWCPPEGGPQGHKAPAELTSTAFYYADAVVLSRAAEVLSKRDDAARYKDLAASIRDAFNKRFYDPATGAYKGKCQTSMAVALYYGLVPEQDKGKVFGTLLAELERCNWHVDCGILGTKCLLHVLSDNGRTDVAYRIASQKTFPSWGHWIEQGATTLWESWDGGASRNHIMFGDISAWMYQALAGINPDSKEPGFKHTIIRPNPVDGLKWVRAEHQSMYGTIRSAWSVEGGKLSLQVKVPANTRASVYIPADSADDVSEGGKSASRSEGVRFLRLDDGCAVFDVGAGNYNFVVPCKGK